MSGADRRLPRLLALVPYLLARPGIPIAEAARDFGVTAKQLRKDLELLWMCGLPGYGPGDLIDLSFDSDTVTVTYDAGMRRPLRLTGGEATALLIALRALANTPGVFDADAVHRAIAKIESAAGAAEPAGVVVGPGISEAETTARIRESVQHGLARGRALWLRYYTASRDEVSERTVDPMRLLVVEGQAYLEAWCRNAEGVRLFRLDRIDGVDVLDEPADPPPHAAPTDVSAGVFQPGAHSAAVELRLRPEARWMAEYYPMEETEELADGLLRVRMRYSDESWIVRLLLGQGGDVLIDGPPELADRVRQRAVDALRRASHLVDTSTG
ncbi:proteasome accessory factor C [Tamaricihabitans halophyticus]|uniref:Proteasome accessory factor C n=1 Tax=Tamaricihabitans halophyticus TaxID=1262583 RepID=A0A4V2STI7_9PSEU|nr:WYL domain-containing protein [Tamaricihabitans halophyticus]TCP50896.1 proteasome accessory factor C [Tamaricihabitans halophyticus]